MESPSSLSFSAYAFDDNGTVSLERLKGLSTPQKEQLLRQIVQANQPIAVDLLPDNLLDHEDWLTSQGYLFLSVSPRSGVLYRHKECHAF